MLELQKIFLMLRFFNRISFNRGLKAKSWYFFLFFLFNPPPSWGLNVLESERPLCTWRHIGRRNTKICVHGASQTDQKCGKCCKLQLFEGKLWVFISYLGKMKTVSFFYNSVILTYFLQLASTIFCSGDI